MTSRSASSCRECRELQFPASKRAYWSWHAFSRRLSAVVEAKRSWVGSPFSPRRGSDVANEVRSLKVGRREPKTHVQQYQRALFRRRRDRCPRMEQSPFAPTQASEATVTGRRPLR